MSFAVGGISVSATVTDGLGVAHETGLIKDGATELTPKYAFHAVAAGTTDDVIVAAVAAKKIRVIALAMVSDAATSVQFNSKPAGGGAQISMLFANGANSGAILGFNPAGWFETVAGEGLALTTLAGGTTGVQVVYVEV